MSAENIIRNKKLVEMRLSDPKKWSYPALSKYFNIHFTVAARNFNRDLKKYAKKSEIERYMKVLPTLNVSR
jgi:hypothetical protein